MTNFIHSHIQRSLTTGFKSSLFPLYKTSIEPLDLVANQGSQLSSIAQMAINIYCPHQRVDDYEHLICNEVTLRRAQYNRHQPVVSVWWLGSPLQQFSPEAITELCFRLSSYFTHQQEGSVRGMAVTPMELDKNNLALMKGLNFNAIKLNIDANIASGDRSLSKIEDALQMLVDYKSFKLSCLIKFSDQTHPEFIERLLSLLEDSHSSHIEVSSQKNAPVSLQDKLACQNQLSAINTHFHQSAWLACGNNNFYAPSHPNANLHPQAKLEASPWGYLPSPLPSSCHSFGVGALSLNNGIYQHNTNSSEDYIALLAAQKAPVQSQFCLPDENQSNFKVIQDLLCRHRLEPLDAQLQEQITTLIAPEWLLAESGSLSLSTDGIINLSTICEKLFTSLHPT